MTFLKNILLFMCTFAAVSVAGLITVSTDIDDWHAVECGYGLVKPAPSGAFEQTDDGIKVNTTYYRSGIGAYTNTDYDVIGSTTYFKWNAGNDPKRFMGVKFGIGSADPDKDIYDDGLYQGFTSPYSYYGWDTFSSNTWYYSQLTVKEDRTYEAITSLGNYANFGGTTYDTKTAAITDMQWEKLLKGESNKFFIKNGDCYGNPYQWAQLAELKTTATEFTASVPAPPPATLFIAGFIMLAGFRLIRFKVAEKR